MPLLKSEINSSSFILNTLASKSGRNQRADHVCVLTMDFESKRPRLVHYRVINLGAHRGGAELYGLEVRWRSQ
ncbi:hypothetical protein F2Q68_00016593 [Brassica cretica]|uniref:Uncharacterized protein n=1 Tax=Brassica cretica TaxID=69181 RepID=A0A8S9HMG4_BRACR|nr:hypothetical protein F2Q68_00016593 [Brassica cretica]